MSRATPASISALRTISCPQEGLGGAGLVHDREDVAGPEAAEQHPDDLHAQRVKYAAMTSPARPALQPPGREGEEHVQEDRRRMRSSAQLIVYGTPSSPVDRPGRTRTRRRP